MVNHKVCLLSCGYNNPKLCHLACVAQHFLLLTLGILRQMMEQGLSGEANLHDLCFFCSFLFYIIYKKRAPMTTADEFLTGILFLYEGFYRKIK